MAGHQRLGVLPAQEAARSLLPVLRFASLSPWPSFVSILQLVSGHRSAQLVAEHQPAKMAAFEGHWKTGPAGLYLFGWYCDRHLKARKGKRR